MSLRPVVVINLVGLCRDVLAHAPRLAQFAREHHIQTLRPPFPAVTCTSQSCMLTGLTADAHGVVGNGWYDRERAEVAFWKQSNALVRGEKLWTTLKQRDPNATTANLFWWFNMYGGADRPEIAVTPRPIYKADGRKIPDIWTQPSGLRHDLQASLRRFPLFEFWGPGAGLNSSRWILDAARHIIKAQRPTLTLIYIPHLDYDLQRFGPTDPRSHAAIHEIDDLVGSFLDERCWDGDAILVSEYGIEPVDGAACPNRMLRQAGLLEPRIEDGREILDPATSRAFAVCDHQIAHVYVKNRADMDAAASALRADPRIDNVAPCARFALDPGRAGDLIAIARQGSWCAYPYWNDDALAPDYARTVDIHRKPGYDPLELFIDPRFRWPGFEIGRRVLSRKLGFRTLLDVIPLDTSLIRGSHGRMPMSDGFAPLLIAPARLCDGNHAAIMPMEAVRDVILGAVTR